MLEASAEAASRPRSLWDAAPAWRNLVITAVVLTAAAVAVPFAVGTAMPDAVAPARSPAAHLQASQVCSLALPSAPTIFNAGVVVGFENPSISYARIKKTEQRWGGQIEPDYIDNPRVAVRLPDGKTEVFLEPKSIPVHIGDRVRVQDAYRNLNLPCTYVPPLISVDVGPAPPSR